MTPKASPPAAHELIDRLYAALFDEAPWQDFVTRASDLLPNGKTVLFFQDETSKAGAMSLTAGLDAGMVKIFNDYYHSVNPWVDHAMERPLGKVTQADELLPREDLKRTEYYQDYLRLQDIETGLGVTLHHDAGLHVFFSIVSTEATQHRLQEARRTLALLVPHLYRAFRIRGEADRDHADRDHADRDSADRDSADRAGSCLQIDGKLRVLSAGAEALRLLDQTEALGIGAQGRLVCKDPDLLSGLQHLLEPDGPPAVRHLHVKRKAGGQPLRVCLYRPAQPGAASAQGGSCFVQLEDPALALPEGVRRFCALHGLTWAEAGIVTGLVAGLAIKQIARQRGTSPQTFRTQLKAIFGKTGCTRQADLVCQVAVMASGGGPALAAPLLIPDRQDRGRPAD